MVPSQGKISRNREEPGLRRGSHAPGSTARSSEGVHDPRVVRRVGPLLGLVDEGVERVRDVRLLLRGGRFASSLAIDSDAACGSICVLVFCTQSGHSASTSLAKARSFLSLRRSEFLFVRAERFENAARMRITFLACRLTYLPWKPLL